MFDIEVAELIAAETRRQHDTLGLIPSENHVSPDVLEASGSVLTNKYSEGYPSRRYYQGNAVIDGVEELAAGRAQELFGVDHANVQPLSGAAANLAVYAAFLEPGDAVLGMALDAGGHLTHGWGVSVTGKWFRPVRYGVRRDTGVIDLDEVRELAVRERPKLIWCGGTAVPRTIDFAGFAAVAREIGAVLAADIAHIAGLIVAGAHPHPFPHAKIVTTTTHKTLRGPRGAMILCDTIYAKDIDRAVFPGLQGGPHNHTTAAIAVALKEAAQPAFRAYGQQIVKNAKALATALQARGFRLISGGTDNHLILIDVTPRGITGKPAARALHEAGIECNYNTIPFDPRKPFDPSGVRIGTPSITSRGMREEHMAPIAEWIDRVLGVADDQGKLHKIRAEIADFCKAFPAPGIRV